MLAPVAAVVVLSLSFRVKSCELPFTHIAGDKAGVEIQTFAVARRKCKVPVRALPGSLEKVWLDDERNFDRPVWDVVGVKTTLLPQAPWQVAPSDRLPTDATCRRIS
jgi:hypothetical protein